MIAAGITAFSIRRPKRMTGQEDGRMDYKLIAVCLGAALLAGFVHGALGMGYGMLAMAVTTVFIPYNNAAAIVSVALLILVIQISVSLRDYIRWREILLPAAALLIGKILGIMLMMRMHSAWLRIALGLFLILYSLSQLMRIRKLQISGTMLESVIFCGLGGFFGGMFNVSGPAASIYCQARYGGDPRSYSGNMNTIFLPSAVVAVGMHVHYGNFSPSAIAGSLAMTVGVVVSTAAGVSVLKRIRADNLRKLSYLFIIVMGMIICISG